MKAGIAVILDAAEICIQERQFLRGKIMIVLVCDEETYSYVRFLLEDEL